MPGFDVEVAQHGLATKYVGRKIYYTDVTGTTMDDAENGAKLKGDPSGTVYITGQMTKGRGTKGRSWKSSDTNNLYMSIVLHRDVEKAASSNTDRSNEFDIDVCGALATLQGLQSVGIHEVKVKWLNDLWVRGHKILGALAEYKGRIQVGADDKNLYILGLGLNMNYDVHRDVDLHEISTSTLCELGRTLSREKVFSKICNHLEPLLTLPRAKLLELYKRHATFRPRQTVRIIYDKSGRERLCELQSVTDNWSVKLKGIDSGECFTESCADISLRPHTDKAVYILRGPWIRACSSQLLHRTCAALVDTANLKVTAIPWESLKKDTLERCSLLVLGELEQFPNRSSEFMNTLQKFLSDGGACLCVGNSCMLFQSNGTTDGHLLTKRPAVITCSFDAENTGQKVRVNLCYQQCEHPSASRHEKLTLVKVIAMEEAAISCPSYGSKHRISQERMNDNTDKDKRQNGQSATTTEDLTHERTPTGKTYFCYHATNKTPGDKTNNSVYHRLVENISQPTEIIQSNHRHLEIQDETIVRSNHRHSEVPQETDICICSTGNDRVCIDEQHADISVYNVGRGKLCLCWPNVEVTYDSLETVFPELLGYKDCLQQTVFARDQLFKKILCSLLP